MKKTKIFVSLLIVCFCLNFAQAANHKSVHQKEAEKYQNAPLPKLSYDKFQLFKPLGKNISPVSSPRVSKTVLGFYPYWLSDVCQNFQWDLLTHVAYFSLDINVDGDINNSHGWPDYVLLNYARQNNVKVVLVAKNFNQPHLTTILSDESIRTHLINNLLNEVQNVQVDGVNIDFENVPAGQRANLTTFMTDLSTAFHAANPTYHVTIDVPAVDWNEVFDENALAQVTDGLVIMGYDYHWDSGSQAGPIAPYETSTTWGSINVFNTVSNYLLYTNNNPTKLILGVPYYGYDWPTSVDSVPANTTGTGEAKTYSENRLATQVYARNWDTESKTPYYKYGTYRQTWYEDEEALQYKYDLIKNQNLAGVGIWALGYDNGYSELWNKLRENFVISPVTTASPDGGKFHKYQSIKLTASDGDGVAGTYYTLNNSTPTTSSTQYTKKINIYNDKKLEFFSVDNLGNSEAVKTEKYRIVYDKRFYLRQGMKNLVLNGTSMSFKFTKLPKNPKKYWMKIERIEKKPASLSSGIKRYWRITTNLKKDSFKMMLSFKYKNSLIKGFVEKNLRLKKYNSAKRAWETIPAKQLRKENKFRIWTTNLSSKTELAIGL